MPLAFIIGLGLRLGFGMPGQNPSELRTGSMNLIKKVGDLGRCCRNRFLLFEKSSRVDVFFWGVGGWGGSVMEMLLVGLFKKKHIKKRLWTHQVLG